MNVVILEQQNSTQTDQPNQWFLHSCWYWIKIVPWSRRSKQNLWLENYKNHEGKIVIAILKLEAIHCIQEHSMHYILDLKMMILLI